MRQMAASQTLRDRGTGLPVSMSAPLSWVARNICYENFPEGLDRDLSERRERFRADHSP
jgi:hypothetical protein